MSCTPVDQEARDYDPFGDVWTLCLWLRPPAAPTICTPWPQMEIQMSATSTTGFIPILQALYAGWNIIGILSDTADSWALHTDLHALATLEVGNLSCIPFYKGSDYFILNAPTLIQAWGNIHGVLPWEKPSLPKTSQTKP
ncbi:hypothetical protein AC578_6843 [Pseudocercospora eumusae]|uniref:Uncharacterized protein n=1 Tax=Pseudocercospora eumusae TaxID=321146 RepID=A0A139H7C0_9PEZI|nr:hypothetical protein AC578_6843 [Pseudocercospora eumusae]